MLRLLHAIGLDVCELYGMSEDVGVTSVNPLGKARIGTVGPPLPGVEVKIGDDGEILVRCAAVFAGYYKDEAATREAVVDGWLYTGDVGEFDEAGYLRVTDRKKDLLITAGGKNISPTNIEVALKEHRLISNAVAIGDQRPYVTALLTLDSEQAMTADRRTAAQRRTRLRKWTRSRPRGTPRPARPRGTATSRLSQRGENLALNRARPM